MSGKIAWFAVGVAAVVGLAVLWSRGYLHFPGADPERAERSRKPEGDPPPRSRLATFGGGCFWCTEAVFQQLKGVHSAVPGYCGGSAADANYDRVCTGQTGHAEAVQVTFDPEVISYDELLEVFWKTHDPTTLDQQGHDHGPQYRSVIFYHDEAQKERAEHYKKKLDAKGAFNKPIVTRIVAATEFYPAEEHHQDFYSNNPNHGYCRAVIVPKLRKFEEAFADKLKPAGQSGRP